MKNDSEFGTLLVKEWHGGMILRTDDQKIVYLSSAYNPLNETQLWEVYEAVRGLSINHKP